MIAPPNRHRHGFTIAELLIAVAIVGILAAIAVPQYSSYIMRSRILDAFAKLSDYSARMEQYFLDRRTYLDDTGRCGIAPAPRSAVLAAEAQFVYTIDQTGTRATVSLPSGWRRTADCWTIRVDGGCV